MTRWLMLMLVAAALCGCPSDMDEMMNGDSMDASLPVDMSPAEVDVYVPTPAPMGALRVNHLQMRGTVDSYHTVDDLTCCGDAWDFVHPSLDVQAREQGIRMFDFDIKVRFKPLPRHLAVEMSSPLTSSSCCSY